jgi:hypothetical protein
MLKQANLVAIIPLTSSVPNDREKCSGTGHWKFKRERILGQTITLAEGRTKKFFFTGFQHWTTYVYKLVKSILQKWEVMTKGPSHFLGPYEVTRQKAIDYICDKLLRSQIFFR